VCASSLLLRVVQGDAESIPLSHEAGDLKATPRCMSGPIRLSCLGRPS
jgi:hypothetical protein